MTTTGQCFCKATSWAYEGEMTWACYCHCDDCRRNCAAPVVAWLGVPLANFSWTGKSPKTLNSSKGVYRHFCEDCGTPVGFEAAHYAGGMHLYAATLDDPTQFEPTFHVNYQSKLPWLAMNDDLPKYEGTLLMQDADMQDYGQD